MVDELAGSRGGLSRSYGGQHHAVVTLRVEASPDRSDFAKLGEATAAEQERTRQFADDVRSQVAGRKLAQRSGRVGWAGRRKRRQLSSRPAPRSNPASRPVASKSLTTPSDSTRSNTTAIA